MPAPQTFAWHATHNATRKDFRGSGLVAPSLEAARAQVHKILDDLADGFFFARIIFRDDEGRVRADVFRHEGALK